MRRNGQKTQEAYSTKEKEKEIKCTKKNRRDKKMLRWVESANIQMVKGKKIKGERENQT